ARDVHEADVLGNSGRAAPDHAINRGARSLYRDAQAVGSGGSRLARRLEDHQSEQACEGAEVDEVTRAEPASTVWSEAMSALSSRARARSGHRRRIAHATPGSRLGIAV